MSNKGKKMSKNEVAKLAGFNVETTSVTINRLANKGLAEIRKLDDKRGFGRVECRITLQGVVYSYSKKIIDATQFMDLIENTLPKLPSILNQFVSKDVLPSICKKVASQVNPLDSISSDVIGRLFGEQIVRISLAEHRNLSQEKQLALKKECEKLLRGPDSLIFEDQINTKIEEIDEEIKGLNKDRDVYQKYQAIVKDQRRKTSKSAESMFEALRKNPIKY